MSCRVFVAATFLSVLSALPAAADHRPVLYPDGTIVHGEWGLYRPGHVVPFVEAPYVTYFHFRGQEVPRTYYFPSNIGDPYAYKPAAPRGPSVRGPRYQRTWSTQPNTPADINEPPVEGPYVIPAPDVK